MERSSLKLLVPALFVVLLLSFMGEVRGTRTGLLKEVTDEERYSMSEVAEIVAEVSKIVMAAANNGNVNLKNALLPAEEALQCADNGSYCNVQFGPLCCPGIACHAAPLVGGICRKH